MSKVEKIRFDGSLHICRTKNWKICETGSIGLSASKCVIDMASIDSLSFDWIVGSPIAEFQEEMRGRSCEVIRRCKEVRLREKNRVAQQQLRQRKVDMIADLERQLSEKERKGREIKETENRMIEVRDGMRREQDLLVDEIVGSRGLDNRIYTIDVASGNFDIVRRVAETVSQTGGYGMQEDFFREWDM